MGAAAMSETGMEFHMGGYIQRDMQSIAARVQNKKIRRDSIVIFQGSEGTGKSTLMSQGASYLASILGSKLTLKNFYFTPQHIYDGVMKSGAPPGTIFLYDEGVTGLLAKQGMTSMHIKLQMMFSTCRSKRYAIFIAVPRVRELPDWLAVDRSMALYNTYTQPTKEDPEMPGFYYGYNKGSKARFYYLQKQKKYAESFKVHHTEPSTFSDFFPVVYEEYEAEKRRQLSEIDDKSTRDKELITKWRRATAILALSLQKNEILKQREISALIDVKYGTLKSLLVEFKQDYLGKGAF